MVAYVGMSKTDPLRLAGSRGVLIQSPTTRCTWDYFQVLSWNHGEDVAELAATIHLL